MGAGMAHYARLGAARQNTLFSLETKGDLDLYCHYVAGLVGEGLSAIFSASSLESPELGKCLTLSNSMGLFLQKTNIMRDFREDVIDGRLFWPKEIWSQGGLVQDPNELLDLEKNGEIAYRALSEMVLDALAHIPDCLNYLALLKNQSVFNFCAIPQVMAIATLDLCFGNLDVFRKNVKIRRTTAAMLIIKAKNPRDVAIIFVDYMRSIHAKLKPSDPSFIKVAILLGRVRWPGL
jgi:farnesyl-diphosphate farnesyltransferase